MTDFISSWSELEPFANYNGNASHDLQMRQEWRVWGCFPRHVNIPPMKVSREQK